METCCSTLACVSSSEECLLKKYLLSNCVLIFPILCGTVNILFPYILSGILSAIWLANLILAFRLILTSYLASFVVSIVCDFLWHSTWQTF